MSSTENTQALLLGLHNRPDILEEVFISSIHGENFLDVEFRAPSRRLATGGVGAFKPILANSTILKAVSPYFVELLAKREEKPAMGGRSPTDNFEEAILDYEDGYDSDLEDEPASDVSAEAAGVALPLPSKCDTPSKALRSAESVFEGDSESDWQSFNETLFPRPTKCDSSRRVVYMKDIAASTMEALVPYLYTGKLYFLPPKSSGTQAKKDVIATHTMGNIRKRPMCSAKSMYRIADKMGLSDLKVKAQENLLSHMNQGSILDEYFSFFSSNYSEIRHMLLRQLRDKHWSDGMMSMIDAKVANIALGGIKHSGPALTLLLREIPPPEPLAKVPTKPRPAQTTPRAPTAAYIPGSSFGVLTTPDNTSLGIGEAPTASLESNVSHCAVGVPRANSPSEPVVTVRVVPSPPPLVPLGKAEQRKSKKLSGQQTTPVSGYDLWMARTKTAPPASKDFEGEGKTEK